MNSIKLILQILVVSLFVFISHFSFGQLQENEYFTDIPLTPNAAAFQKYTDIPVSEYTGIPNINIPIYDFDVPGINTAVRLSYHASGLKVAEEASWVGLGWSLNAGGQITQVIKGKDDFSIGGFGTGINSPVFFPAFSISNDFGVNYIDCDNNNCNGPTPCTSCSPDPHNCAPDYNDYLSPSGSANAIKDWQSDSYSFNFYGYSGSFILDLNGEVKMLENEDFKIYKYNILNPNSTSKAFTIVTPDANQFIFNIIEESKSLGNQDIQSRVFYLSTVVTSKNEFVHFEYETINNFTSAIQFSQSQKFYFSQEDNYCPSGFNPELVIASPNGDIAHFDSQNISNLKILSRIYSTNYEIRFGTSSREDVDKMVKLDQISFYTNNNFVNSYNFDFGYFQSLECSENYDSKRLKLNTLTKCKGQHCLPSHVFEYNSIAPPCKSSFSRDYWGFYNGVNNPNLIANPIHNYDHAMGAGLDEIIWFEGADRRANSNFSISTTLETITYPSGATFELDYEGQTYSNIADNPWNFTSISYTNAVEMNPPITQEMQSVKNIQIENFTRNVKFDITLLCEDCDPLQQGTTQNDTWAHIFNTSGTTPIDEYFYLGDMDEDGKLTIYRNLGLGEYTLEVNIGDNSTGIAQIESRYHDFETVSIKNGGGLRVKRISRSDGLITKFSYDNLGESEGVLRTPNVGLRYYDKNLYFSTYLGDGCILLPLDGNNPNPEQAQGGCHDMRQIHLSSESFLSPSYTGKGTHLGYSKVIKEYGENGEYGSEISQFINEEEHSPFALQIGGIPNHPVPGNGKILLKESFDPAGFRRETRQYAYTTSILSLHRNIVEERDFLPVIPVKALNTNLAWYNIPVIDHRLESTSNKEYFSQGSVYREIITSFTYDVLNRHKFPAQITTTDGNITTSKAYKYAHDLNMQQLIDKNYIGIPIEVLFDGGAAGGNKVNYQVSSLGAILPSARYSYLEDGTWQKDLDYFYDDQDIFPDRIQERENILEKSLKWGAGSDYGLIKEVELGDRSLNYEYYYNRLLKKVRNFDDLTEDYDYDDFLRLDLAHSQNFKTSKYYSYHYGQGNDNIETSTSFYDNVYEFHSTDYFDPLGRLVKNTLHEYSPTSTDIGNSVQYDYFGRTTKICKPLEGSCVIIDFEDYFNGYKTSMSHAGWPVSTSFSYTLNTSQIESVNKTYLPNTLLIETIIDENNNVKEYYRDFKGQLILETKSFEGGLVNTEYLYNARGEVVEIKPEIGDSYLFDYENGLLQSKTIPKKGTFIYGYNDNDLVETITFPEGDVEFLIYDDYGQVIERKLNGATIQSIFYIDSGAAIGGIDYKVDYILGDLSKSVSTSYGYDHYGRVISKTVTGLDGTTKVSSFTLDGLDNIVSDHSSYSFGSEDHDVFSLYSYDHSGRLVDVDKKINNKTENYCSYVYNEMDKISSRKLGEGCLQSVGYTYNSRGWLTSINGNSDTSGDSDISALLIDDFGESGGSLLTKVKIYFNENDLINQNSSAIVIQANYNKTYFGNNEVFTHFAEYRFPVFGENNNVFLGDSLSFNIHGFYTNQSLRTHVKQKIRNHLTPLVPNDYPWLTPIDPIDDDWGTDFPDDPCDNCPEDEPVDCGIDLFNMNLYYEVGNSELNAAPQFNGNISWVSWSVHEDDYIENIQQSGPVSYGFTYDELDRLLEAEHSDDGHYDVSITYDDVLGNIGSLVRNGYDSNTNSFTTIDDLTYVYNGDQLQVTDNGDPNKGATSNTINYDSQGRMTDNADILSIEYNHLDLPNLITLKNGKKIKFFYDSEGNLHKKQIGSEIFNYLGEAIFRNSSLEQISMEEGRYVQLFENDASLGWGYEYVINDHLGNGRVWFSDLNNDEKIEKNQDNNEVTQEKHYYPFGMTMDTKSSSTITPNNRFQYNSKEFEHDLKMYNYGARFYDPSIGRFSTTDRFAEMYSHMTPYQYGANNPIKFIDVNGDSLRVTFQGDNAAAAKTALYGMIENALEGQYSLNETSTGNLQLTPACGSESCEGLSEQGQAVLNELNSLFDSDEQTDVKAEYGSTEVHTGNHESETIDVADILQFNADKSELGGTQIGKIVHEFAEQNDKQNTDYSSHRVNHKAALKAEDRVNFSTRTDGGNYGGKSQNFTRGNNKVNTFISTKGRGGSIRRVVQVTNTKS